MKELKFLYIGWDGISIFLRTLSLEGGMGNVLALFLYFVISLLPVLLPGILLWRRQRKFHGVDMLLPLLSAYTLYLLYVFINPGLLSARMPKELRGEISLSYLKAIYGGLWLSLLLAWLLLTWIRNLNDKEILDRKEFLYRGMGGLLLAAMTILGIELLYSIGVELSGRLVEIRQNAGGTRMDILFAFLQTIAQILPSGFLLGILYRIKGLLKVMEVEPFGEEEVQAAKRLASISKAAVFASILVNLLWNGALFCFTGSLTHIAYHWEISLFPFLTAFGALILARYLREAGEIRRDNEMII